MKRRRKSWTRKRKGRKENVMSRVDKAVETVAVETVVEEKPVGGLAERIRFTPRAWAKLWWMCSEAEGEVSGLGVVGEDRLLVEDVHFPKQTGTSVTTVMDEEDVAKWVDEMVGKGHEVWQLVRVWVHTHPAGLEAKPSSVDENCWKKVVNGGDWGAMVILNKEGRVFGRVRVTAGCGLYLEKEVPVGVEWKSGWVEGDLEGWKKELENVEQREGRRESTVFGELALWEKACRKKCEKEKWKNMEEWEIAAAKRKKLMSEELALCERVREKEDWDGLFEGAGEVAGWVEQCWKDMLVDYEECRAEIDPQQWKDDARRILEEDVMDGMRGLEVKNGCDEEGRWLAIDKMEQRIERWLAAWEESVRAEEGEESDRIDAFDREWEEELKRQRGERLLD
jgi:proteasome lid subunit RPN8/RPN11